MTHDRDAAVLRLFEDLMDLEQSDRAARLAAVDRDPEVVAEVTSLLEASRRAGDFLGMLGDTADRRPLRAPGDVIASRFRLERLLGAGAMGDVYLAWDQQLERFVALKFLRGSAGDTRLHQPPLISEARSAARLNHPNVATIHDIGTSEDGHFFIAMAYYERETLRDRIARGPMPEQDALRVAAQLASALAAAHDAGIVHRDVKPANVLFDASDVVKLTDFGVATLGGDSTGAREATAAGTVAYMSPEQARGLAVDSRSDLWSLGVVIHEMLTGTRPAMTHGHRARRSRDAGPGDVESADPLAAISEPVRALVHSLLELNPDDRPGSAAGVSAILTGLGKSRERVPRASGRPVGDLPRPVTGFVGRESQVSRARELMRTTRLLTLTGPGGTGKTRLALHVAALMRADFPDGAVFVPLADIASAELVPLCIAQAMGLRDLGGESLSERVVVALRDRTALLVLDNFEHVRDASPFVARLLSAAPNLAMLATSREPLEIQGEQELMVPPLITPVARDAAAGDTEAVQLFVQRARAVRPDFQLDAETLEIVGEICRRLDGLPLALELAAARAKLLSPRAMLARLEHRFELLRGEARDRPARHGTMRSVIDWSYVLLTDAERALFERIAVFAGGVSLEAAEAVSGTGALTEDSPFAILEVLGSLCNKSLLHQEEQLDGEPRFVMLETMREFGLDRLRVNGEERAARQTHRAYHRSLAERAAAELRGPGQAMWLDRIEREYANFRIAIDDGLADGHEGLLDAARIAVALHRFWFTRGPLFEGVEYLRRIIAEFDASAAIPWATDVALRARLLSSAAQLANISSLFPESRDLFARSLALHRETGNTLEVATTLNNLAWTVLIIGDLSIGETMSSDAMAMHESIGNELGVTLSLNNLAWIAMERGEYQTAENHFTRVIEWHRERGDRRAATFAMSWLGFIAAKRGDYRRAVGLHEDALTVLQPIADRGHRTLCLVRLTLAHHELGDAGNHADVIEQECLPALREDGGRLWPIAFTLTALAIILRDTGQLARARRAASEALAVRLQTGAQQGVAEATLVLATVQQREGDVAAASAGLARALAGATSLGTTPIAVESVEAIATLALQENQVRMAAVLLGAAHGARLSMGAPLAPRNDAELRLVHAHLRRVLGELDYQAAVAEGQAAPLAEAGRQAVSRLMAR